MSTKPYSRNGFSPNLKPKRPKDSHLFENLFTENFFETLIEKLTSIITLTKSIVLHPSILLNLKSYSIVL